MKIQKGLILLGISMLPSLALAGWQVVSGGASSSSPVREPFFESPSTSQARPMTPAAAVIHNNYAPPISPVQIASFGEANAFAVSISGSVKENIVRIMSRYHWRVVWKAPYDYNFDGRIVGYSLENVIQKLLQPFPLQAVMYAGNRTVAIVPRYPI